MLPHSSTTASEAELLKQMSISFSPPARDSTDLGGAAVGHRLIRVGLRDDAAEVLSQLPIVQHVDDQLGEHVAGLVGPQLPQDVAFDPSYRL